MNLILCNLYKKLCIKLVSIKEFDILFNNFSTIYGTRYFTIVFTRTNIWPLSRTRKIQFRPLYSFSLRTILIIFSSACLGHCSCLFPSAVFNRNLNLLYFVRAYCLSLFLFKHFKWILLYMWADTIKLSINPLNAELNPICCLLSLLVHHFLHVSRIRVISLTLRLLMSYI